MASGAEHFCRRHTAKDSVFSWYMAILCMLLVILTNCFVCGLGTVFVAIRDSYGVSREEAAVPLNAMLAAAYFSGISCGPILRKFSIRKTLCVSVGVEFVASFLQYFTPLQRDLDWILICMVARGLSMGVVPPVALQIVSTHFEKHRAKALMLFFLCYTLSGVIMPFIYNHTFDEYGYKGACVIDAAIVLQSLVLVLLIQSRKERDQHLQTSESNSLTNQTLLSENEEDITTPSTNSEVQIEHHQIKSESFVKTMTQLMKNVNLYVILFSEVVSISGFFLCNTVLVDYAMDRGLTKTMASSVLAVYGVGELCGKLPTSWFVDKVPNIHEVVLSVVMCSSAVLYFILPICSDSYFMVVVFLMATCYGASQVTRVPLFPLLLGVNTTALTYGLASFLTGVMVLMFPLLIGKFRDELKDYKHIFHIFGMLLLMASVTHLISRLFTHRRKLLQKHATLLNSKMGNLQLQL